MAKLEISKELQEKITKEMSSLPWDNPTELDGVYYIAQLMSQRDLDENGLTAKDIYALAIGDYKIKTQYEVGQYYYSMDAIFKVRIVGDDAVRGAVFYGDNNSYFENDLFQYRSARDRESRHATEAEIALFDRAAHFSKQGRHLDEFKAGDIVRVANNRPFYFTDANNVALEKLTLICPVEKRGDL